MLNDQPVFSLIEVDITSDRERNAGNTLASHVKSSTYSDNQITID